MHIQSVKDQVTLPRPLRASLWDVAFYSLMVGLGEMYLSAFVLTMGFSERASGMLVTLPTLIGSIVQLAAGFGVRWIGSQRIWVMISASIQATALLGLSLISIGLHTKLMSREMQVFSLICMYWTFGLAAGPSWSSWIGSIVPPQCRTQFFAQRIRVSQLFTVVGLVIAGLALEMQGPGEQKLPIFAMLFAISAVCRYVSVGFLQRHPDSLVNPRTDTRNLLKKSFWQWIVARRTVTIIAFLFLTQMAVSISGPFFNAYMLKQLALDYHSYVLLIATAFLARVLAGGVLQKLAHRLGSTTLTHLGAILIVPMPALWVLTTSFEWLLFFQVLTGFAWGCHELGVTLLLLDKQSHKERASLLTITQLLNASAMFLGSWIGFLILGSGVISVQSYASIFLLSTAMRMLPLLVLPLMGDSRIHLGRLVTRGLSATYRFFTRAFPTG